MPFGLLRCPECRTRGRAHGGRRFSRPSRRTFDGGPAPVLPQERVCLSCGAWLWVHERHWRVEVMPAAPRLSALAAVTAAASVDEELDAVLAGIAATAAYQRELSACLEPVSLTASPAPPGPRRS